MIEAPQSTSFARNHWAHEYGSPIDPGQARVGLRPDPVEPVDHSLDAGAPLLLSAAAYPPPVQRVAVAVVSPLLTIAQVMNGVAIFGTAGGRAVLP